MNIHDPPHNHKKKNKFKHPVIEGTTDNNNNNNNNNHESISHIRDISRTPRQLNPKRSDKHTTELVVKKYNIKGTQNMCVESVNQVLPGHYVLTIQPLTELNIMISFVLIP